MSKEAAAALRDVFISPNVCDANLESANVVDVLHQVSQAIVFAAKHLGNGDASTPMGAIEAHGKAITDAAALLAASLDRLSDAVRDVDL